MSNKYNEMKAFTITTSGGPACVHVYLCRGAACDYMRSYQKDFRNNLRLEDSRILFYANPPEEGERLYRRVEWVDDKETGRVTSWYQTDEESVAAAKAMHFQPIDSIGGKDYYVYQLGFVHTECIEPLPEHFEVEFKLNDKGRLYTRLNAHPERDGEKSSGGKFFFSDKNFVTADIGKAMVSISKEFDNYGFLTGEMVKVEDVPELEAILDWAWEERLPIEELVVINHPGRGRYYAIDDGEAIFPIRQIQFLGESQECIYASKVGVDEVRHDIEKFTERRATFYEFFAEDAWGKVVQMSEIDAMFKESEFFAATSQPESMSLWEESIKYHGDAITKAVKDGILLQFKMPALHIEVVSVEWANALRLLNYPLEEVAQLATEVSAINAKADKTAEEAQSKGKFIC